MNCNEIQERMPDVAAGFSQLTVDEGKHLQGCAACAEKLNGMRSTMALLDQWQTPEPSPYFDVRLQARLREEMAKPQTAGWITWFRRPVLAAALTVLMGVGVGLIVTKSGEVHDRDAEEARIVDVGPGSAVSDLQALDKNHDMYSDFDLLDELDVQQDVVANP
jgi:predicted anti-sigma-YlaC factor YlaD